MGEDDFLEAAYEDRYDAHAWEHETWDGEDYCDEDEEE